VKLNAAAILREDAALTAKHAKEAAVIRAFEGNLRDTTEYFAWQEEMRRQDEQAKLDESISKALDAIRKFGKFADVTLFVAGHTDTVGPTGSNRTLSLNRARSIAAYFRKKGVTIPIRYEGFGEAALAVGTDDEVDDPRNRRAQYIIAIETPRLSNGRLPAKWQKL
jgi:outer membrane protein OmpA-like peptidoglycan-associated protein